MSTDSRRQRQRQQFRGASPLTMMLLMQIYSQLERLPVKPPVTIFLLAANIWPHVSYVDVLGYDLANISQNCLHPEKIVSALFKGELLLNRLVLSSLIHVDDHHLYYNMLSLCWKGINLEAKMGSAAFLQLVVFSLLVSHSIMVLLAYILYTNTEFTSSYHTCAVGFSAVLFSLKYVWNQEASGISNIMGMSVPTKYAAWFELVLVSILTPNVSFIGHLAGIFAGILYVRTVPYWGTICLPGGFDGIGGRRRYTYASGNLNGTSQQAQSQQRGGGTNRSQQSNTSSSTWSFFESLSSLFKSSSPQGSSSSSNTNARGAGYRPRSDSDSIGDLDLDLMPDRDADTSPYVHMRSRQHASSTAPSAPSSSSASGVSSSSYSYSSSSNNNNNNNPSAPPAPLTFDEAEIRRRRVGRFGADETSSGKRTTII